MKLFSTAIASPMGDHDPDRPGSLFDARGTYRIALAAIIFVALALRLYSYDAGLPSINDPDEPLFVLIAGKMLAGQGLNPGWFGHPGTITFYSLAILFVGIMAAGVATGRFASEQAFIEYVYSHPAMLFAGGRLLMVAFGTICVILTAILARRLFGNRVALLAAGLLAVSPLHITFSQIIRTDMQVSIFMVLAVLASLRIARGGKLSAYIAAGVFIGLGCATKWPAATFALCPICAATYRASSEPAQERRHLRYLAVTLSVSLVTLLTTSPYLILDYKTVLSNLGGEFQPHHLGATGTGFLDNLFWYLSHPIRESLGLAGITLCLIGGVAFARARLAALLIGPAMIAFLMFIGLQTLVWDRWIVPLLPFFSILAALGSSCLWDWTRPKLGTAPARVLMGALACAIVVPLLLTARANATERLHDTRNRATAWIERNVPPQSSILLEHFGLDLLTGNRRLLFPAGAAGCIDAAEQMKGRIEYNTVHKWRGSRAIVDFGTVAKDNLATCNADIAIFSHYDRYAAERAIYPHETAQYEQAIRAGTLLKTIRPSPGKSGGPTIRIVKMRPPQSRSIP